jgi:CRISPR-associated protein Cmr5
MATIKTIEQGRAKYAYTCVKAISTEVENGKYKSYIKKIPSLIKVNGLGATVAFICGKKKEPAYQEIYKHLSKWLKEKNLLANEEELLEKLTSIDSSEYRRFTLEVLSLLIWLKRFADALIEKEEEN